MEGLRSAIARLFQTFDGKDLYPTPVEKASALAESLIINHPFIDGNKRTGFLAMASFLREEKFKLNANQVDAYNFTIRISTGEIKFEEMVKWLKINTIRI